MCEVVKIEQFGREKARRRVTSAVPNVQLFLVCQEHVAASLKEMDMEHISQELHAGNSIALYYQKDKRVYHLFYQPLAYCKL